MTNFSVYKKDDRENWCDGSHISISSGMRSKDWTWEKRFKRDSKRWNIKELYHLWAKTRKRHEKYKMLRNDCIKEICEKIPKDEKFYTIYKENKKGEYIKYRVGENCEVNELSVSKFSNGVVGHINESRDDKLDFFIDGETRLRLGNKYFKYDRLCNDYITYYVYYNLWLLIEPKIKEKYKNTKSPDIFEISICGDNYYIKANRSYTDYVEYELTGGALNPLLNF